MQGTGDVPEASDRLADWLSMDASGMIVTACCWPQMTSKSPTEAVTGCAHLLQNQEQDQEEEDEKDEEEEPPEEEDEPKVAFSLPPHSLRPSPCNLTSR